MEFLKTFIKSSGVIVLVIILAACSIKAYRVPPSEIEGLKLPPYSTKKESVIYFNVPQLFEENASVQSREEPLVRAQVFASMLERTLIDNPTFDKAVLTSAPPQTGFYSSIKVRGENHFTLSSVLYLLLSSCTATLIPYYNDDTAVYVISYELYKNGEPVKMYQHRVQQKTLIWMMVLLAVPFVHDSWDTPPWVALKEVAFAETAKLFWLDAHRDGFF
jgi:hypothetical protein